MENEVDQIAYPYGEKHVVREERFGNSINSPGLRLVKNRQQGRNQADDEKRHKIIAYQNEYEQKQFRIVHIAEANQLEAIL